MFNSLQNLFVHMQVYYACKHVIKLNGGTLLHLSNSIILYYISNLFPFLTEEDRQG